jgi:lysyl-tRNA synthetase, class II
VTIDELVSTYLNDGSDESKQAQRDHLSDPSTGLIAIAGAESVNDFAGLDKGELLRRLTGAGLDGDVAGARVSAANSFFHWLVNEGHLESHPFDESARRSESLARIRATRHHDPYRFDRTHELAAFADEFAPIADGEERVDTAVAVAGRIRSIRRQGKLTFVVIGDRTGEMQLFISKGEVGDDSYELLRSVDLGDWLSAEGHPMRTRRGELSVKVARWDLQAKSLRRLPNAWRGVSDADTRYRQRYVDLAVNAEARRAFAIRHATLSSIRRTMGDRGFIEIEGPMLQIEAGGAHARPFITHHNALDQPMFLRIALELHLKRLIVGGMDRVFEMGRVFRNEGISTRHNPEFTMMESYQAFADVYDVMELTEAIIANAARDATGSSVVAVDGRDIDFSQPFRRVSMIELIAEHSGEQVHPSHPRDEVAAKAAAHGVKVEPFWPIGKIIEEFFEHLAEHLLIEPTFVTGHPVDISPLARVDRNDPFVTERFELFIGGRELANAYSELNDPVVQRARFEDEQAAKEAGDAEAGTVDEDYLRALEYGMPPTGGLGIGVDRLVMLLAGTTSIKDVILFPTLRPEASPGR